MNLNKDTVDITKLLKGNNISVDFLAGVFKGVVTQDPILAKCYLEITNKNKTKD